MTFSIALTRAFGLSLVAYTPLLALLLIPQLMRSRAGSETLLMFGTVIFIGFVVGVILTSPRVSAVAARDGAWGPQTFRQTLREARRKHGLPYWRRLGEFVAIFVAGQVAGLLVAVALPYISDNPEHATNPAAHPWIIHYKEYAAQAVVIYLIICFAAAWYGTRLRKLALQK